MNRTFLIIALTIILCAGFRNAVNIWDPPAHFPIPVYDFKKAPLTAEKVHLGKLLFYDPILSRDSSISCASCHSPFNAFAHTDHDLSHGIDDRIGTRNAPALMNLAWQREFMWDGASNHLHAQALAPITNPLEMDEQPENIISKLNRSALYRQLFELSFGDTFITTSRIVVSLAQFQLTLISADSKYDRVMEGREQFTAQEINGYKLFRQHCAACHREPLFTNYEFRNNGLSGDPILRDAGKYTITQRPSDSLLFKVPTLRNVEYSYPYMHDGRFKTLYQVLGHYTGGISRSTTLAKELQQPIVLKPNEQTDLVAFLLTLSDRNFIFNPQHGPPRSKIFSPPPKD